jgi:hypothetical protein
MDCDAAAFEVGDRVVVEYDATTGEPTVIGFAEEPRECSAEGFIVTGPDGPVLLFWDEDEGEGEWVRLDYDNLPVQDGGQWFSADGERRLRFGRGSSFNYVYEKLRRSLGSFNTHLVTAGITGEYLFAL